MRIKTLPTAEFLNECFAYDSDSGALTWRERPQSHFVSIKAWKTSNRKFAGKEAGSLDAYCIAGAIFYGDFFHDGSSSGSKAKDAVIAQKSVPPT